MQVSVKQSKGGGKALSLQNCTLHLEDAGGSLWDLTEKPS